MDMPEVLAMQKDAESGKVRLTLAIPRGLDIFRGHFEGAPIVPGVVQINWALKLANQYLCEISPHAIVHMEAVKFQHVIVPDSELGLELELSGTKLMFVFSSQMDNAVRYSSGKVVLSP